MRFSKSEMSLTSSCNERVWVSEVLPTLRSEVAAVRKIWATNLAVRRGGSPSPDLHLYLQVYDT